MRGTTNAPDYDDLLENVAAISALMHSDRSSHMRFYARYAPMVGGFPGIYALCVAMARELSSVSPSDWGEFEGAWHDVISRYVDMVLAMGEVPSFTDIQDRRLLRRLALTALRDSRKAWPIPPVRSAGDHLSAGRR